MMHFHESQHMTLKMWREESSVENACFVRSGDSDVQCYFTECHSLQPAGLTDLWRGALHYLSSEIGEEGGRGETLQTHVAASDWTTTRYQETRSKYSYNNGPTAERVTHRCSTLAVWCSLVERDCHSVAAGWPKGGATFTNQLLSF